jgi:hypothetical protein
MSTHGSSNVSAPLNTFLIVSEMLNAIPMILNIRMGDVQEVPKLYFSWCHIFAIKELCSLLNQFHIDGR